MTPVSGKAAATTPLDDHAIGRRQLIILGLAVLLAAIDGYDALSMAFVAPVLSKTWHLDKAVLGLLLSAGLMGMAFGSLVISPLADRIGRRPSVLVSLAIMTAGSLLSAASTSVPLLAASRVLTGIGIGVMIVLTTLISAEFSNLRHRAFAVSAVATIGFPLGGIVGGLTAGFLLRTSGWPWVFLIGGVASVVLFAVLMFMLPESVTFLLASKSEDKLARVNQALSLLGHAPLAIEPEPPKASGTGYSALFTAGSAGATVRLIVINALLAMAAYFLLNWLPQLVADAGFPPATGGFVSAASGVVGLAGGLLLGALAARLPAARLATAGAAGMGIALAVIGLIPPVLALFVIAAGAFSFCLAGTTGVFYGLLASHFPPLLRASGMGLVMGVGRIASAAAPAIGGLMFANGLARGTVSLVFAVGPLVAAVLLFGFRPRREAPNVIAAGGVR